MKVKRGFGLLVVALIAFLSLMLTVRLTDNLLAHGGAAEVVGWGMFALSLALCAVLLGGLVVGLVLIAWGLLRD